MKTIIDWKYPDDVIAPPDKVPPVRGAKPVYWWMDGQWYHKGWMMPEVV